MNNTVLAIYIFEIVIVLVVAGYFLKCLMDPMFRYVSLLNLRNGYLLIEAVTVALFIVLAVVGGLSARYNLWWLLLPSAPFLVLTFFVGRTFISVMVQKRTHHQESEVKIKQNIEAYETTMRQAPHDFVCDDGTFFSIDPATWGDGGDIVSKQDSLLYYPPVAAFSKEEAMKGYEPDRVGFFSEDRKGFELNGAMWMWYTPEARKRLGKKLSTAKNKEGKLFPEIYNC